MKSNEYMGNEHSIQALRRSPQNDFPEHCHDFSELVLVCSGSGIHVQNDSQKVILPNSLNVITESDYHLYESTNNVQLMNICYKKDSLNISEHSSEILKEIEGKVNNITVTEKSFKQIFQTAKMLEEEQFQNNKHSDIMATLLFERILLQIDRLNVGDLADNQVVRAIVFMCDNYKERDLTVACICEQFEITPSSLNSKLISLTGLSANKFINALRINKAKKLLVRGISVTEIAYHVGFHDSNYFSTKFKAATGYNPSNYLSQIHFINDPNLSWE
ncbi:helix-turn-helix domain-containing protein [Photobacterium damselae]|uniref:helix-turn-helix domain-containing protein n=1 Tax=Photobacterium damselae TaxID=38293 RepID=UPI001EFDD254|nr:helix-turn-helix domain-containing protein [Photobacterium damselae]MCG9778084.1 helix-turn-helix domain-containing protein [Photobacterium damselae]